MTKEYEAFGVAADVAADVAFALIRAPILGGRGMGPGEGGRQQGSG
jgi:hypothetical protein